MSTTRPVTTWRHQMLTRGNTGYILAAGTPRSERVPNRTAGVTQDASPYRTGIHQRPQGSPQGSVAERRAGQGCHRTPGPAQRRPLRRRPLRYAARPGAAGGDDLRIAHYGGAGRPLVPHPAHHRRPGAAPGDDDPLGLGKLRHDGPLAGLHELHLHGLGRLGGLLCPGQARVQEEHGELSRVHPRERRNPDPCAGKPATPPTPGADGHPARGRGPDDGQGDGRRHRGQGQPHPGNAGANLRRNRHLPGSQSPAG